MEILDACQLLQVGIEVCPYAAKEEYGLERDSREDVSAPTASELSAKLDKPKQSVVNICGIWSG